MANPGYYHWSTKDLASFARGLTMMVERASLASEWELEEAWDEAIHHLSRVYADEQTQMSNGHLYGATYDEREAHRAAYRQMHDYLKSLTLSQRGAELARMGDIGAFPDCHLLAKGVA